MSGAQLGLQPRSAGDSEIRELPLARGRTALTNSRPMHRSQRETVIISVIDDAIVATSCVRPNSFNRLFRGSTDARPRSGGNSCTPPLPGSPDQAGLSVLEPVGLPRPTGEHSQPRTRPNARHAVPAHQQPAGQPCRELVARVAGGGLRGLHHRKMSATKAVVPAWTRCLQGFHGRRSSASGSQSPQPGRWRDE